jgi:hypothetical protein
MTTTERAFRGPLTPVVRLDAAHRISLTAAGGRVNFRINCRAGFGALCRQTCTGTMRGICHEAHDVACDRTLVDGGECLPAAWLNVLDAPDVLDAYAGPKDVELTSGPIAVRWSGFEETWQWMYAEDLPEDVTPEEWTRAQA